LYRTLKFKVRRRSRHGPPKSWLDSTALFDTQKDEIKWCKKNGINWKAVREMHIFFDDIKDRMEAAGFLIGELNSAEIAQQRTDMIGNLKLERVPI
jgi:hypothetical protein